jgi:extradiol dioxygenase family protein
MSDSPLQAARARADQIQVATAGEGTVHFGVVLDGNYYIRPATHLEQAMAQDIRQMLDVLEGAAVVFSDPRLNYVELQVDAEAWKAISEGGSG